MDTVEIFKALGEPTRLEMVERLSSGKLYTINTITKDFNLSRQGARKHLQILANSKIVTLSPAGRDVVVRLNRHSLDSGKKFISRIELQWEKRLLALRDFVDKK